MMFHRDFHHGHERRRSATLALGILVGIASTAAGQSDEPIVVGSRQRLEGLHFDYVRLAIEAFAQRVTDEVKVQGQPKRRDTEDLIRETLELTTKGYIGHRDLVTFDLTGRLRLSQERFESDTLGMSERTSEVLNEFDTTVLILGQSQLPVTLFGRRDQILLNRTFGGTVNSSITEAGVRLAYQNELTPMQLEYRHRDQSQDDPFSNTDFELTQDSMTWSGQYRPSPSQNLTWNYIFDIVEEQGNLRPANSFNRHDAVVTHSIDFGPETRHNLRSSLRFFKETGDFAFDRLRWDEILRLRHSSTLRSRFEYLFDQQERANSRQLFQRASAQVDHQLYKSLRTIAEVGGSLFDSNDGDFQSHEVFGRLDLEYQKKVPYGQLEINLDGAVNWQDSSDRGGDLQVTDDANVFNLSGVTTVTRRNIELSSIVVTDSTGLIVFTEGVDYTVRQFGDRVEITLIPGGNILAGQAVLVDYVFTPDPANTTVTTTFGGSVRYTIGEGPLRGVSPFLRYLHQSQDRDSDGSLALVEANIEDITIGLDYNIPHLSFSAEQQYHDSTLSPFDATRIEAQFTASIVRVQSISIIARYDDIDHTDDNVRTRISSLTGRWNGRLSDRLRLNLVLLVRDQQDSAGDDSLAFEQRLNMTWRYQKTEVFGSVRNAFVNSDRSDTSSQVLMIGLRREF